jgi:hypothetical protein
VAVGISTFEPTGIYRSNCNRVPKFLFSIYNTSETITALETAHPNMALVCLQITSVTNPQNVLPISVEPFLSTKNTILPSDSSPEEITAFRLLQKISLLLKIPKIYSTKKLQNTSSPKKLIISKKSERSKKEIKSKSRDIESVNSPNKSRVQRQKMQRNKS